MTIDSVTLKPGVLFASTPSGGTLMDIQSDRFIALSRLSATIWGHLVAGSDLRELLSDVMRVMEVGQDGAEALLQRQLERWQSFGLINQPSPPVALPVPKSPAAQSPGELETESVRREPIAPWVAGRLFAAGVQYRRALLKNGLAMTLSQLQGESGPLSSTPQSVTARTVRSDLALRRGFRQGLAARDCLHRSLALAAILRRQGVEADLCIGIIDLPFTAHAWVEALGLVVNETASRRNDFTVIGRF